jgi:hypothetical protein
LVLRRACVHQQVAFLQMLAVPVMKHLLLLLLLL